MELVTTWGPSIVSAAALGLSALSLGYAAATRRSAVAKARRRAETTARQAVFQTWRSNAREHDELSRRIDRLEAAELARHAGRPFLTIAKTGGEPDLEAA